MVYDPGPEGYCGECRRMVPLRTVSGKRTDRQVLVDHLTYRNVGPHSSDPGPCFGRGSLPDTIPRGADRPTTLFYAES